MSRIDSRQTLKRGEHVKIFLKAAAALLAIGGAPTAHAAVVTKSYEITGLFKGGPMTKVTTSFDLTFESTPTAASNNPITIANFKSDGGASFSDPVVQISYARNTAAFNIWIGGNGKSNAINSGTDDFQILLNSPNGADQRLSYVNYTTAGTTSIWSASEFSLKDVTDVTPGSGGPTPAPVAAAVPEPATWAMMILGFGVVGGSMRRRPKLALRTA